MENWIAPSELREFRLKSATKAILSKSVFNLWVELILDGFDTNQTQTGAETGAAHAGSSRQPALEPELTVVIISYNTRELTLKALETLFATTLKTSIHVIVLDNDSKDGSVDAIREYFSSSRADCFQREFGFCSWKQCRCKASGNRMAAAAQSGH